MSKKTNKKNSGVEKAPSLKELNNALKKQLDSALQELRKRREQAVMRVVSEPTRRARVADSMDGIDQKISTINSRLEDINRTERHLLDQKNRLLSDKSLLHEEFNSLVGEIIT